MADTTTHTTTTTKVTFKDRALRVIAILGLIALLLLGAWGIIQIAFVLYGFLGNTSPSPTGSTPVAQTQQMPATEVVVVNAPPTIQSGTPFTLSFSHENASGNYAYQISYTCAAGLSMQAPVPTGAMQTVPCNTPFNFTNATSQVQLIATNSGKTPAAVSLIVAAKNLATNAITSSASANTSVTPAQTTTPAPTTSKPKPSTSYVPATRTSNLYGSPDLSVSMGTITSTSGRYSAQFTIQNTGTNIVPAGWTFNAQLPTSPTYTYTSNPQQQLYPGDKIVYTLGFTMQNNYSYTAPSYNYNNYGTQNSYPANCGYAQNYTYNGVYNYPGGSSYTCNTNNTNYPTYNQYVNNAQTYPSYNSGVVTVTVDPNNFVAESSEYNNTSSKSLGY